jgi:hypothetical protein
MPRKGAASELTTEFCRACGKRLVQRVVDGELMAPACPDGHVARRPVLQAIPAADVRPEVQPRTLDLGLAPIVSLVGALGLVIVAMADNQASVRGFHFNALFWIGTLAIFLPHAARLVVRNVGVPETIALIVTLTLGLYVVKILLNPTQFVLHDEFLHWRTADDILRTGRLFGDNPLLPTSSRFPALEATTVALADLGGISIFHAGVVVAGAARLVLMLALFLVFTIAGGRRIGAVGIVVYTANPNFLLFNAAFKYETMALAFAALCIYLTAEWTRAGPTRARHLALAAGLAALATAVSHHLTAIALAALLATWCLAAAALHRLGRAPERPAPWLIAAAAAVTAIGWILVAAPVTIAYLAPVIGGAVGQGFELLARFLGAPDISPSSRELFGGSQPGGAPLWERIVAVGAVGLTFGASLGGAWLLMRRRLRDPLVGAMLVAIPLYPVTLFLRLTPRGWETANRSSEFLFAALAIPAALALVAFIGSGALNRSRQYVVVGILSVMFMGGVVAGWSVQDRLPRPYACCSAPRAVNDESVDMAYWLREAIPEGSHVGADPFNHLLVGSYGEQTAMTTLSGGVDPNWVIFARRFDADARQQLTDGRVEYLVVDDRVATNPDEFDEYVGEWTIPEALAKFDDRRVDRLYDSGHIHVYDVSRLWLTP